MVAKKMYIKCDLIWGTKKPVASIATSVETKPQEGD
jgi:hypothetical protein